MVSATPTGHKGRVPPPRKPRGPSAPGRSAESQFTILLEAIEEGSKATIEAVFASAQRLELKMEEWRRDWRENRIKPP